MPTVPLSIRMGGSTLAPPETIGLTAKLSLRWVVSSSNHWVGADGVYHSTFSDITGMDAHAIGIIEAAVVNITPFDQEAFVSTTPYNANPDFPGPLIAERVLATSDDDRGCSLSITSSELFASYTFLGWRPLVRMTLDFSYPEEWDDGHVTKYFIYNVFELTWDNPYAVSPSNPTGRIVTKLVGTDISFSPFWEDLDNNLLISPAEDYYVDSSLIRIPAGFPSPYLYPQRGVPLPSFTGLSWAWGDGTDNSEEGVTSTALFSPWLFTSVYQASASSEVAHEFKSPSSGVYVRATDSYGRRTPKMLIVNKFSGNGQFSAVHSTHGELFSAQPLRPPGRIGTVVKRSITNAGASQELSFTNTPLKTFDTGALAPNSIRLGYSDTDTKLFFDSSHRLHRCLHIPTGGVGLWSLWDTSDCGETWVHMTNTPFDTLTYSQVIPCSGMSDGYSALIALVKESAEFKFALYNGASWTTPIVAGSFPDDSRGLAFFQENFAGSSRLRIVGNGLDKSSSDYGEHWEDTQ